MNLVEWIVVGVIQGVFEWLPASSQGVISLVLTQFFGQAPAEAVNSAVFLHSGTMLAALVYFSDEYMEIARRIPSEISEWASDPGAAYFRETSLLEFLFVSTLLTGLVGGPIYLFLIDRLPNNPSLFAALVGASLVVTGLMQYFSGSEKRSEEDLSHKDSLLAGALQGLAIIPGVSRSGSTLFGLFARDFDSGSAFRLSFIMSVPAVFVAQISIGLFENFSLSSGALIASLTAFIVGYISIEAVLEIAERVEVAYLCFALAVLSFLFAL